MRRTLAASGPLPPAFRGLSLFVSPLLASLLLLFLPTLARAGDIVIGMSAPFRGPSRGLGIEMYRGAMAWLTEVNTRGGVHGKKVVLKAYHDSYDPEPAIENTRKLILDDRALLLFGY